MKKAFVLVEGQTEETFIRDVLSPYLAEKSVYLTPVLVKTRLAKGSKTAAKGGVVSYSKVENDVRNLLRDSVAVCVTTMFDFYGLAGKDFPGWDSLPNGDCYQKVAHLEWKWQEHIVDPRFRPYFAIHEFEALLFTQPEAIARYFPAQGKKVLPALEAIRKHYDTPEQINEDEPPSKRLEALLPYVKTAFGALIVTDIGLTTIRTACKHFDEWVTMLEQL